MNIESLNCVGRQTRREFLKKAATVAVALGAPEVHLASARPQTARPESSHALPWYRRTLRWGQTNTTERDPTRYDIAWWRQYWKRPQVQGVIINAGGIVTYYPSRFPLHRQAEFLGDRARSSCGTALGAGKCDCSCPARRRPFPSETAGAVLKSNPCSTTRST